MQRSSPRKRKQVFPEGSPPPSKNDIVGEVESPERRSIRRNLQERAWEEEQRRIKEAEEMMEADAEEEEKIEVDHVEEVEEVEEEIEVDDPVVEEEVIEEYVDDFNIPLYAEHDHTIHVSGGATGGQKAGQRRYAREFGEVTGRRGGAYQVPRINDGDSQFGGALSRRKAAQAAYAKDRVAFIPARPPVHLRTTGEPTAAQRARLLPVAVARNAPVHHRYGQGYGGMGSMALWREEQKRKMELLDIYESLPAEKQASFLNYLNQTGETFIPPPPQRAKQQRRSAEGDIQTMTRVRVVNGGGGEGRHHTVQVPAHMAESGAEMLISPQPDGRARLMSLIPVGEEEKMTGGPPQLKKSKSEGPGDEGTVGEEEEDASGPVDTSDMPQLEADKEALMKRKEERMRAGADWADEEVDVENCEDDRRMEEEGEEEEDEDGEIPTLNSELRRRQGLFYVPELDGFQYDQHARPYTMCAPKMKGGLRLCESCNVYMRKSVFYHHQRTVREHGSCSAMTPRRFECGVPECNEKLPTIERLCVHMAEEHGMPTDVQESEFLSEDEFQAFLVELESKGGNFRMSRGNKCGKTGIVRYYRCNRVSNPSASRGKARKADQSNILDESNASITDSIEMDGKRKPALLRTEKICTAFYRKAEGIDGRISVRYCDFHLHEDVKVKLPESVKERITQMLIKKLPMPVIVEVIKAESDQFARSGSELERRIYAIGEKDVRNVYCTYLSRKRKDEVAAAGEGGVQSTIDDVPELSECEAKFLMAFEKAEGKSIHEVAKGSKATLERRRRRDGLRQRLAKLQSFFKTDTFIAFSDNQLSNMEDLFAEMAEMCGEEVEKRERMQVEDDIEEEDIEEEEGERAEGGGGGEGREGSVADTTVESVATTSSTAPTPARKRGRPRKHPLPEGEEEKRRVEREERREERRERVEEEIQGLIKEEEEDEISFRSPTVTSRGRQTKPKRFPGEDPI